MKKVKFGLVGAGNVANYHMISLSSIAEAEITALCDVDKEKLKEAAGKFNIKKLYSDYNELLKDENVEVVEILCINQSFYPVHYSLGVLSLQEIIHYTLLYQC